jgi:hypothetical protein
MAEPIVLPRWVHHPTLPSVFVADEAALETLLAQSPDWRAHRWSDDEKAAWQASRAQQEDETPADAGAEYSPRRRR